MGFYIQLIAFVVSAALTVWILGVGLVSAFHPRAKALTLNIWIGLLLLIATVVQPFFYGWIAAP